MKKYSISTLRRVSALLLSLILLFGAASTVVTAFAEDAAGAHVHVPAGEPVWHWAEDYSSCVAVFVCDGCGCEYERQATVTKDWQNGPDENGRGKYYFIASVTEGDRKYADFTNVFTEQGANVCKWCGKAHGDGFFEKLVAFFHRILAAIFGAKY